MIDHLPARILVLQMIKVTSIMTLRHNNDNFDVAQKFWAGEGAETTERWPYSLLDLRFVFLSLPHLHNTTLHIALTQCDIIIMESCSIVILGTE